MTITKSSSKSSRAIFKSALKSKVPFIITTTILLVLIIAVPYFMQIEYYSNINYVSPNTNETVYDAMQRKLGYFFSEGVIVEEYLQVFCVMLLGIMSYAVALNANSYMHSKSKTDLYHSLPVTRRQMLLTNMAASMTAIIVPYTVVHYVVMIAQQVQFGIYNCFGPDYYLYTFIDYFTNLLFIFVIYAFTTLICTQVGTVFDALAITGVAGFIPLFFYMFCGLMWDSYTYGASFNGEKSLLLSPFLFVFQRYIIRYSWNGTLLLPMLIWLVLGIGILCAAVVLYDKRRSEKAGQTQSQGVLQTITKMFVAFCGAILFFGIFYNYSSITRIIAMIIGGACIGIIAELILSRGAKHLLKNLKWLALGSAMACVVQIAIVYDFIGYETRVPQPEKVAGVTINYKGGYDNAPYISYYTRYQLQGGEEAYRQQWDKGFTDQEIINTVVAAHRVAINNRPPKDFFGYDYYYSYGSHPYESISITYHLTNGRQMERYYSRVYYEAISMLAQLEDKEQFIRNNNPIFWSTNDSGSNDHLITHLSINHALGAGALQRLQLDAEGTAELMEALRADILAEPLDEILYPNSPTVATLYVRYTTQYDGDTRNSTETIPVQVKSSYAGTMAVLEKLGASEYLESKEILPDSIYVIPMEISPISTYSNKYRLVRVQSISTDSYSIQYVEDDLPEYEDWQVDNPVRVRALLGTVRSSIFMDSNTPNVAVCLIAVKNGKICGYSYAYSADLPDFIRSQVVEYQNEELQQLTEDESWNDYYHYYF